MIGSICNFINKAFLQFLSLLPKKNKIIFINMWGRGYGDSLKYIADEILNRKLPYDLVWLVGNNGLDIPEGIRKVKYYSIRSKIELSTAKVIINNAKGLLPFIKKNSQYYIQTWHGGFALKYIEKEAEKYLSPEYVRNSKYESSITDLILSGSDFQTGIIEKSFWYNGEIFKHGIPRNDILLNVTDEKCLSIKKRYGLDDNCKYVIYVPTFRDDNSVGAYGLNAKPLLESLNKKTGKIWKLLIRLHPNVSFQSDIFNYDDNVINATAFDDPQELLLISDLLITDYSSIMIDFAIMRKPVFLFALDLEYYVTHCRNLRPIFYQLPFELCRSNDELINSIVYFDMHSYLERLDSFMEINYKSYDDGYASKWVVDRIVDVIKGK